MALCVLIEVFDLVYGRLFHSRKVLHSEGSFSLPAQTSSSSLQCFARTFQEYRKVERLSTPYFQLLSTQCRTAFQGFTTAQNVKRTIDSMTNRGALGSWLLPCSCLGLFRSASRALTPRSNAWTALRLASSYRGAKLSRAS